MREALARSDIDFTVSKPDTGGKKSEPARFPRILRAASISTAVLFCGVIIVNALFLQDRKHPAPLLRAPDPVDATPAPVVAPTPPQRPVSVQAPVPASAPAPAATVKAPGRDAIADELNRMTATPDRKPKAPPPAKTEEKRSDAIGKLLGAGQEPSASVMAAQKALVRLGYVLRPDGVLGLTTRQAIERYEKDHKLPVHGELTPKLSRELSAKSGLAAQ